MYINVRILHYAAETVSTLSAEPPILQHRMSQRQLQLQQCLETCKPNTTAISMLVLLLVILCRSQKGESDSIVWNTDALLRHDLPDHHYKYNNHNNSNNNNKNKTIITTVLKTLMMMMMMMIMTTSIIQ